MDLNRKGCRYFLDICTINNNKWMILPDDIKKLIWKYLHTKPYIKCIICKSIILCIEIDVREDIVTEYYENRNYNTKCINC